jgi:hypothetical protein
MTQFSHGVSPKPQGLGSMPDNVVFLDHLRQGRSVPVMPSIPGGNPQERISIAVDKYMIDKLLSWAEARVELTTPMTPRERAALIRALDALLPEPRQ